MKETNSRQKFQVEIIETLTRTLMVEASDELEALSLAKQSYDNEEIVLNAEDYIETEFKINRLIAY